MNGKRIAIAGIHTGIGKTIASAVLAEALGADYWKPVQAGDEDRDTLTVQRLITDGTRRVYPEAVLLKAALSPHAAAAMEGIEIDHTIFLWPETDKLLLVETAGGLLSPISGSHTMADLISHYQMPVILVSQNYLGSINHTLLTLETLKSRGIKLLGIVMNGAPNADSESFIERYSSLQLLGHVPHFETLDSTAVRAAAAALRPRVAHLVH